MTTNGLGNVAANVSLFKASYQKFVSLGEKATTDLFKMTVAGYPDLEFLVQNVQIPPVKREKIESFGPMGVQFGQQGRPTNTAESPITFVETLRGDAYKALREWVRDKKYLDVTLILLDEDEAEVPGTSAVHRDCFVELEGVDLSVEDATLVKPTGTLHINFNGLLEIAS